MGKKFGIIGCGGVGTYAAMTAAKVHDGNPDAISLLGLFDADTLETRNFGRIPRIGYEGDNKAMALKDWVCHNSGVRCLAYPHAITAENIDVTLMDYDTIICCTDDVSSQRLIKLWCQTNNRVYQRAGYDGDTINVCRQMPITFDQEAEAADGGYHGQPEVYHAMLAGTLAVYSVIKSEVVVMGEVSKLHIADSTMVPAPLADAIVDERWADVASSNNWHDSDDCQIPDGYHSYEECDHENCWEYDAAVDSWFDNASSSDIMHRISSDDIDYIVEHNAPTCGDDPKEWASQLEDHHDRNHRPVNYYLTDGWCPFCRSATKAA